MTQPTWLVVQMIDAADEHRWKGSNVRKSSRRCGSRLAGLGRVGWLPCRINRDGFSYRHVLPARKNLHCTVDACRIGAGRPPLIDTSCLANERFPCTRLELPKKLPFTTPGRPHTSTPPFPNIHTTTSLSSPISPHISPQASNPVDSPLKAAEAHRSPFHPRAKVFCFFVFPIQDNYVADSSPVHCQRFKRGLCMIRGSALISSKLEKKREFRNLTFLCPFRFQQGERNKKVCTWVCGCVCVCLDHWQSLCV
jgi:hypothetical protein